MWQGVGVLAGLLAFLLAVALGMRASGLRLGPALPMQLPALALSALVLLFTFIRFLDIDAGRTGAAWGGLLLALALFLVAYADAAALMRMFRAMRSGRAARRSRRVHPTREQELLRHHVRHRRRLAVQARHAPGRAVGPADAADRRHRPLGPREHRVRRAGVQRRHGQRQRPGLDVSVTQPMPVDLDFSATVEGDAIAGMVKAGPLGEQPFSGTRA